MIDMSEIAMNIAGMVDLLPEDDQLFAEEFIKKLVLAWDPNFTKLTKKEAEELEEAEKGEFIPECEIDWDNLKKYDD